MEFSYMPLQQLVIVLKLDIMFSPMISTDTLLDIILMKWQHLLTSMLQTYLAMYPKDSEFFIVKLVGFDSDAGKFFIFVLTLVQVSVCGTSFAFLFSATFGIFAVANLMAAVLYTIMLVCTLLFINFGTETNAVKRLCWIKKSFFMQKNPEEIYKLKTNMIIFTVLNEIKD